MTNDELSINHWTCRGFREVVSTKSYQAILDRYGSWVFRDGDKANIKGKKIGPGRYEIWLESEE